MGGVCGVQGGEVKYVLGCGGKRELIPKHRLEDNIKMNLKEIV